MNKLIFLTVAAMLACTLAQPIDEEAEYSQAAIFEDDATEISYLSDNNKIFAQYCIDSREHVRGYLKETVNSAASRMFNILFNNIADITKQMTDAQREAVAEGAELIEKNGVEQTGNNVRELEQRGLLRAIGDAVKSVVNRVVDTISSEARRRLQALRDEFNGENIREQINQACRSISFNVKSDLNSQLTSYKRLMIGSLTKETENLKPSIQAAKVEDVGCVTTGRITNIARFCDLLLTVGPVVYPLLGF